jgi:methyl coenzyme M reductase subunit C-like uncharacterized protein (methanogenesis marker protein 7)
LGVGSIKHGVEALKESVAVDKVETFTTGGANGVDDEVDVAGATTYIGVEGMRPDLAVRGESVGVLCKMVNKGHRDLRQKGRTLPTLKFRFSRALYWVEVMRRRPVVSSKIPPVADWYKLKASIE